MTNSGKKKEPKKESGFEDDPVPFLVCQDRSHQPPSHLVIPPGKIYRHVCPSCGREVVLRDKVPFLNFHS